jgi:CheY-like chemotaxis protein
VLNALVVDDDAANRAALGGYLRSQGHAVTSAESPDEALSGDSSFDVAFVDFNLNGRMDGIALIRALRKKAPAARYALVTAAREQDYVSRARAAGVKVLRKPLAPADLDAWLADVGVMLESVTA